MVNDASGREEVGRNRMGAAVTMSSFVEDGFFKLQDAFLRFGDLAGPKFEISDHAPLSSSDRLWSSF